MAKGIARISARHRTILHARLLWLPLRSERSKAGQQHAARHSASSEADAVGVEGVVAAQGAAQCAMGVEEAVAEAAPLRSFGPQPTSTCIWRRTDPSACKMGSY